MFSMNQKKEIAEKIEKILLSFGHPEMPKEKPIFHLHVKGKEKWSWADIDPNWKFESDPPGMNLHNKEQEKNCKPKK